MAFWSNSRNQLGSPVLASYAFRMRSSLTDEQTETFTWIGLALLLVQGAEAALRSSLRLPFHSGGDRITVESLEADDEHVRRKTLGQLIGKLRQRAEIAPAFETLLSGFLTNRNRLVHHLSDEFDHSSAEGRIGSTAFCRLVASEAAEVMGVLYAVQLAWMDLLEESVPGLSLPREPVLEDFRPWIDRARALIERRDSEQR